MYSVKGEQMRNRLLLCLSTLIVVTGMIALPFFSFSLLFPGEPMPLQEVIPITLLIAVTFGIFIFHVVRKRVSWRKVIVVSTLSALLSAFYSVASIYNIFHSAGHITRQTSGYFLSAILNMLSVGINLFCMIVVLCRKRANQLH